MDEPCEWHRRKRLSRLRKTARPFVGRGYRNLALPCLAFIEVLHTLLDQVHPDLEDLGGNDAEVPRWLLPRDQALAYVTNPFTSTLSDQDRVGLIFAGKFSPQEESCHEGHDGDDLHLRRVAARHSSL